MISHSEDILDAMLEEEDEFEWQEYGLLLIGDGCYKKGVFRPQY